MDEYDPFTLHDDFPLFGVVRGGQESLFAFSSNILKFLAMPRPDNL